MMTRHERGKVTWVDLESPTAEELHSVMREFDISGNIEEEIISPTPYPLVISFPSYSYLVLHFPVTKEDGGARTQEVDFIVSKKFIITVRYEVVDSIHSLHKVFEAEELLGLPETQSETEQLIVEQVFRRLFRAIREEIETTERMLERLEVDIFSGKERSSVRKISEAGRVLLRFETVLRRNAEPLSEFLRELQTPEFFGKSFALRSSNIEAEREHVEGLIESLRNVAAELRQTNDSLLSSSQNQVMKTLTVVTFIMFPLSIIPLFFAVDTTATSIIHHPEFFFGIGGLMAILAAFLYILSKFKRWF